MLHYLKLACNKKIVFWIALALFSIFLACLSTNYDYDLFARLIVGERFVEQGILPFKDFLSYTPTHPWYDHEWGSGVIFYLILKHFKAGGLLFLHAIMLFSTSIFIIKTQRLKKHAYPTSLLFMWIFLMFYMRLNPSIIRCQFFSFLFFSIFLYILEATRIKKCTKLIWLLPLITIIWNNLHGGVVSGLGLIGIYFIGAILEKKQWKTYLIVLFLSTGMLIINPYGVNYLEFLFSATTKTRTYITEWWPFYARRHITYYTPSVIYGLFGIFATIKQTMDTKKNDYTKFIILISTLYLGAAHVKLLSLTIITVAALCYNDIVYLLRHFKKFFCKIEKCIYPAIFALSLLIPLFSPLVPRCDFTTFPLYEIEFLKINNIKGNIVTPFGLGSYTTYKLYPDNLVYMDGRYEEVYDDYIFNTLKDFELVNKNWKDILTKYPTDILMPIKNNKIYNTLKNDKDWVLIFDGRLCGIFVKKENVKFSYLEPEYKIDYYRKTIFKHGEFKND